MADQLITVSLSELHESPDNLRQDFGNIPELAKAIDAQGLIEPIVTRKREEGGYWIVAGARRGRALKHLGRKKTEVILREYSREEAFFVTVAENAHRASFNAIELSNSYARMRADFGLNGTKIAQRLKLNETDVYDLLGVNDNLLEAGKKALANGRIGLQSAIWVARVRSGERVQNQALEDVLQLAKKEGEQPPVRAVKKLIQERYLNKARGTSKSAKYRHQKSAEAQAAIELRRRVVARLLVRVAELVERRAHLDETDMRTMALATATASPTETSTREVFERRRLKPGGLSKVGATQLRSLVVELALASFVALDVDGEYSPGTKAVARAYGLTLSELEKGVEATANAEALFKSGR